MFVSHVVRHRLLLIFALLLSCAAVARAQGSADNPIADPKAVVIAGHARFTVLTSQLIRMEWAEDGKFEDHASFVFINRHLPVPHFDGGMESMGGASLVTIRTDKLSLTYRNTGGDSGRFTSENLKIEFDLNGRKITWSPGLEDKGNLQGTIRTLDGVRGSTPLGTGLISRDGWVVVDDSDRPLFDNSDWPWAMPRPPGKRQDLYFFGYGHDYRQALLDFTRVAGKIPLPPRFAFGTWWSRYWAYTDEELKQLVGEFHEHDVPLDVLVIDMDWHLTFDNAWRNGEDDPSGHRKGWTGYTWNPLYFPDPTDFLKWVHQQGLKDTLNMHPASGVQPHEAPYPEMARAMGIDPATRQYVKFDIVNKTYAENYMKILHYPLERQGVDFFWLDWQQEPTTSLAGVNPTWWLNYVHFTDMERRGKRPIIYHRWGGLGNHRYEIGFSGDVISSWESLTFQPYFTASAANVGYGYWSHDIGGHIPGPVLPEIYTRWIQFGAFSPILRTHTTKNPAAERRIWAYPPEYAESMRATFLLRYALIPYIYTSARNTYDTGISICHPLYYDYPEANEAYEFKDEYLFGDALLVSPVTAPLDPSSQVVHKKIWLPPGEWIEWFSGSRLRGPAQLDRSFALNEIPVYVKAGAILPMQPKMSHTGEKPVDPLILTVFPGDSGETRVYDDTSETLGYKDKAFTWTLVRQSRSSDGSRRIEILPMEGSYPGMLTSRGYEIHLPGSWPPESVSSNGRAVTYSRDGAPPSWSYDGDTLTTIVSLPHMSVHDRVEIIVQTAPALEAESALLDGTRGRLARLSETMNILNGTWSKGWSPDDLIEAVQTGNRITLDPSTALAELRKLRGSFSEIVKSILAMPVDSDTILRAMGHLDQPIKLVPAPTPAQPSSKRR